MSKLSITVLGSGTSQGVPVIACDCHVCTSKNKYDNRLRSSILVNYEGENFVVDAGPDFRYQMLRAKVKSLRGVLFTHEHKDHIGGLDDVRAFNFRESRDMEVFCSKNVEIALHREYHYVFSEERYPGIPMININKIDLHQFELPGGLPVTPIRVMHYKMPVTAFRFFDFTYITDAKTIDDKEIEKIKGTKVLVVNALRLAEHISHFNLQDALELIDIIKPEKTYLTHISHLFGTHDEIQAMLPENVYPAYDGLTIELEVA
jgi:phosphoribosyl 1,2-cyclic phosphate phosphodiesterase